MVRRPECCRWVRFMWPWPCAWGAFGRSAGSAAVEVERNPDGLPATAIATQRRASSQVKRPVQTHSHRSAMPATRFPAYSAQIMKILFVWDFDWTIINCNSDEYVPALFLGHDATSIGFRDFNMSAWKWLLLAGFLGSIFNGLGHGLLQNEFSLSTQMLGYAIGDMSGQFALMIALIYYFRYIQKSV